MTRARPLPETEAGFQSWVLDRAHLSGWRIAHFRPAQTNRGWRTPVEADGKGFFDLVLMRPPRVIFAELKSARGEVSVDQAAWEACACQCPGVEVYLWRPHDRDLIERILR